MDWLSSWPATGNYTYNLISIFSHDCRYEFAKPAYFMFDVLTDLNVNVVNTTVNCSLFHNLTELGMNHTRVNYTLTMEDYYYIHMNNSMQELEKFRYGPLRRRPKFCARPSNVAPYYPFSIENWQLMWKIGKIGKVTPKKGRGYKANKGIWTFTSGLSVLEMILKEGKPKVHMIESMFRPRKIDHRLSVNARVWFWAPRMTFLFPKRILCETLFIYFHFFNECEHYMLYRPRSASISFLVGFLV